MLHPCGPGGFPEFGQTAHLNPGIAILESQFIMLEDFDENRGKSSVFSLFLEIISLTIITEVVKFEGF